MSFKPELERLPDRINPSVTASYANGVLSVYGDEQANAVVVSQDGAGNVMVTDHGNPVVVTGGTPTTANVVRLNVFLGAGNDSVLLDPSLDLLAAQAAVALYGGSGNDTLAAGNDRAILYGQEGNDSIVGGAGNDMLFGQAGDDTLFGAGGGTDYMYGGEGNDSLFGDGGDSLFPG